MPERFSRRDFLTGVLFTGTAAAAATYFAPGGRAIPSVVLNFVTGVDPTGARDLLILMWNRANPSTKINIDPVEGSTADQRMQMLGRAQVGAADILNLDIINVSLFKSQGYIEPLELIPNNFLPKTLIASRLGNSNPNADYWAAPFNADVGMLFARGDPGSSVRAAALPSMSTVIDTLVPRGSHQFAGQLMPLSSSSYEAFVVNVLEHALSRDGRIIDEYGAPAEQLEVWQAALEPLQAAIADGRMNPGDSEEDTRDRFREQRLAYMRNWPVKYRELQRDGDAGIALSSVRVGSLPLGVLGGQSLAITRNCVDKVRAKAFIDYLTSDSSQKILASYGLAATSLAAYADQNLRAFIPHLDNVRGAIEEARLRPAHPNYQAFSDVLVRNMLGLLQRGQGLTTQFINELLATLK